VTGLYLLAALFLVLLNGLFVLAEFAIVKLRPTRVSELVKEGRASAGLVRHIQTHLDEYLSVCQIGITFASIGLGFVGEPAFARLLQPLFGSWALAHGAALAIAYVIVSFLHILLGELIPKSLAIRLPEQSALLSAPPLRLSRALFYLPLVVLNGSANLLLRLLGFSQAAEDPGHTKEELRIILGESQSRGLLSLRRLLLIENVFDLEGVLVRDVMRPRAAVRALRAEAPWEENLAAIRASRFSRYPLLAEGSERPAGIVHVKDILFSAQPPDLGKLARPPVLARESSLIEDLLDGLQRHRAHLVLVLDAQGGWSGIVTMEDLIEEIVGAIEDEFETEPPLFLGDSMSPGRTLLGVEAESIQEAVREALSRVPPAELPVSAQRAADAVAERESRLCTYLGRGVAVPHARLEGLAKPCVVFARSERGIPVPGKEEKARLLFILLTPADQPKTQLRLLARLALFIESGTAEERLLGARSSAAVVDAVRALDPMLLGRRAS